MTPIRLIALDLDGTLLATDHETLSPANRAALDAAAARGIEVVVATGRSVSAISPQVLSLPYLRYFITCNGSAISDRDGHILREAPLAHGVALGILQYLCPHPHFAVQLYAGGRMVVAQRDWDRREELHIPPHHLRAFLGGSGLVVPDLVAYAQQPGISVEKINLPHLPPEERESVVTWLMQHYGSRIRLINSMDSNLEINDSLACKGWALSGICSILGIPPSACAAFGDADNDLEMVNTAGIGVAMGNAIPALLAAADYVTATNAEDGVAAALYALGIL